MLFDDLDKANAFNNFFAKQTLLDTSNASVPTFSNNDTPMLRSIRITSTLVKDILDILNTNKSSGPDDISPLILKNTSKSIAPVLAKLFNFSLRSEVFPTQWKLAHGTPIFKKENRTQCKNYRPISLLPCLSKVERCVFKEVFNYLHSKNKLSHLQAAYNPGNSTEFQLLEIYHIVAKALEDRKDVSFVFCDISKAFDKVWHVA